MAVERADLSLGLSVEPMVPVPVAPAVPGQSSPEDRRGDREDKPRHRPPLEKPSVEAATEEAVQEENNPPQHRIDSLA